MNLTVDFEATSSDDGQRFDTAVAARLGISRTSVQSSIRRGTVRINGAGARSSLRVRSGDRIHGHIEASPGLSAAPEEIPLNVVYEDHDLAVIDKPAGLVVHPAPGHTGGTLANALMARFPATAEVGAPERPGIVHRLDKDTSGLMVVALTERARADLQRQLASRQARREYLALAGGHVPWEEGRIEAPVGRSRTDRKRMSVFGIAARDAVTEYVVLEYIGVFTYLRLRLRTGRTHQIRVHLASVGHPLAGDSLYRGPIVPGLARQFLHAAELHLLSPSTGRALHFISRLPSDLRRVLAELRDSSQLRAR